MTDEKPPGLETNVVNKVAMEEEEERAQENRRIAQGPREEQVKTQEERARQVRGAEARDGTKEKE